MTMGKRTRNETPKRNKKLRKGGMIMTDLQKRVLQGLIDGKSYTEIGNELGVSRQSAWQCANQAVKLRTVPNSVDKYPYYPYLRQAIIDKGESIMEFARNSGVNYATLLNMIKKGRSPRWDTVEKLVAYTGVGGDRLMMKDE